MHDLCTSAIFLTVALTVVAVGCDDGSTTDSVEPLGTIELYNGDGDRDAADTAIITTTDDVAGFAALLREWDTDAADALAEGLAGVDTAERFVALIEYDRCGVTGTDLLTEEGELRFAVESDGTVCASAEDVVDAFAVGWPATGDDFVLVTEQYDTPLEVIAVTDRVAAPIG